MTHAIVAAHRHSDRPARRRLAEEPKALDRRVRTDIDQIARPNAGEICAVTRIDGKHGEMKRPRRRADGVTPLADVGACVWAAHSRKISTTETIAAIAQRLKRIQRHAAVVACGSKSARLPTRSSVSPRRAMALLPVLQET